MYDHSINPKKGSTTDKIVHAWAPSEPTPPRLGPLLALPKYQQKWPRLNHGYTVCYCQGPFKLISCLVGLKSTPISPV